MKVFLLVSFTYDELDALITTNGLIGYDSIICPIIAMRESTGGNYRSTQCRLQLITYTQPVLIMCGQDLDECIKYI